MLVAFESPLGLAASPVVAGASGALPPFDFRRVFDAEFRYVWSTLRRLGVSPRDAEDITHDVFLKVYDKRDAYDPSRPIRPWLFGFAFRAASDYRRLARHRVELMDETAPERAGTSRTDAALAQKEEAALVDEALSQIDLEKRAVLVAYEMDESPMKEIAESMGVPLHTAYSRLKLARAEFAANVRRLRMLRGES